MQIAFNPIAAACNGIQNKGRASVQERDLHIMQRAHSDTIPLTEVADSSA